MLTKIQLLTQNEIPKIFDISLLSYIEFFDENFHGKIYEYKLDNYQVVELNILRHNNKLIKNIDYSNTVQKEIAVTK